MCMEEVRVNFAHDDSSVSQLFSYANITTHTI